MKKDEGTEIRTITIDDRCREVLRSIHWLATHGDGINLNNDEAMALARLAEQLGVVQDS